MSSKFIIVRYNDNGSVDNSFGMDGKLFIDIGADYDYISEAFCIDPLGRIIVGGEQSPTEFALFRYNENGRLDNSFGVRGKVLTDFDSVGSGAPTSSTIKHLCIDGFGRIVVCGYVTIDDAAKVNNTRRRLALARYNVDGSLDTTFGRFGKVMTEFSSFMFSPTTGPFMPAGYESVSSLVIDGRGKIIIAGYVEKLSDHKTKFALARYNDDGSLDSTFGGDGKVITDFYSSGKESASAIAIDGFGKVVAAGWARLGSYQQAQFALARYNDDGSLDSTFDGDGKVLTDFHTQRDEYGEAMVIDGQGRIIVSGSALGNNIPRRTVFALARYNYNGSLDTSFDHNGKVLTDFTSQSLERIEAMTIDKFGRIVVGGYSKSAPGHYMFALARYKDDGTLDNTFDHDGKVVTDLQSSDQRIVALEIDSFGKILVLGTYSY